MLNVSRSWRAAGLSALLLAGLLPLLGNWLRVRQQSGCALDGLTIPINHRVRIVIDEDSEHVFCSIQCAELWLESSAQRPKQIIVTDETTGGELNASEASFVLSGIVTHAPTADARHAFARRADAVSHAETFRGRVLTGDDRPFATWIRNKN